MKISTRNYSMGVLALLLLAANFLWVRGVDTGAEVERLFPTLDPDRAARIEMKAPDGAMVTLIREPEGPWTLEERFGWRAYQPAVESLLRGLAGATTAEREGTHSSSHASLGVDQATANHLRVEDRQGLALADLYQGAAPVDRRGSRALPSGQDSVFRTPNMPRVAPDPSRWIDPSLLSLDANTVVTIQLELRVQGSASTEPITLMRQENGRFALAAGERTLPPAVVDPFLKALESLVARDVVAAPDLSTAGSTAEAGLEVRIETRAGLSAWLTLGYEDAYQIPAPLDGAVHAAVESPGDGTGERTWFALPLTSANRLIGLANAILATVVD